MAEPILLDQLATEVWDRYTSSAHNAERVIEDFLRERFRHLSTDEQLKLLDRLVAEFEGVPPPEPVVPALDEDLIAQISALLLGRSVERADLTSGELAGRLGEALNTLFDSLNRLTGLIHKTLRAGAEENRTIRQVIGSHLEGDAQSRSLEEHLGQVSRAFLTVQRAFKEAARSQLQQVLDEMDPKVVREEAGGAVFRIGPFAKAEYYSVYRDKFERIRRWFDSGRFMEDYLREFEKNCQKFVGE
jgi:hypothetical protein